MVHQVLLLFGGKCFWWGPVFSKLQDAEDMKNNMKSIFEQGLTQKDELYKVDIAHHPLK